MKNAKLLFVLIAASVISANTLCALTPDDLAAFLRIYSWHTVVDLPPDSYSIQVFKFADGKIADTELINVTKANKASGNDVTVMVGSEEGKYRWMIRNGGGSYGSPTTDSKLERTLTLHLPEKVQEGDFILLGEPLRGADFHGEDDLRSYSTGYLLRIKRKP